MQNEYASVSSLPFSLGTRVCFMLGKENGRQVSMEASNGKLKSLFAGPLFLETHTPFWNEDRGGFLTYKAIDVARQASCQAVPRREHFVLTRCTSRRPVAQQDVLAVAAPACSQAKITERNNSYSASSLPSPRKQLPGTIMSKSATYDSPA